MQNLRQAVQPLKWKCPCCAAKIDCDIPYCKDCGFGLPKIPRPIFLIISSTLLFFLIGFPAGLMSLYSLVYMFFGHWEVGRLSALLGIVFVTSMKFMLLMSEGTRRRRYFA